MNPTLSSDVQAMMTRLGLALPPLGAADACCVSRSPIDGAELARLPLFPLDDMDAGVQRLQTAQRAWSLQPAPRRGDVLRRYADVLRQHQDDLGALVTLETGKIASEGRGEVQEMIDICDFAVGLSRQLYGRVIASERPQHQLLETWHPMGVCGVITAFNFPVAVWAWNAALALVCGNAVVWKPSPRTPLCAWVVHALWERTVRQAVPACAGIAALWLGDAATALALAEHPGVRLVSATGSTAMGRVIGPACARQFKRSILELGGNNAAVVCPSANLDLATRAMVFAAVGTAGQRCTSLRRAFVHESVYDALRDRLLRAYASVAVGDPRLPATLMGPLIDVAAGRAMQSALDACRAAGNRVHGGDAITPSPHPLACYVRPALVEVSMQHDTMLRETFAPILYLSPYRELEEAIALSNASAYGLSSCIFTESLREAQQYLSDQGSDCGIANVNVGTSGAEIGGAFGGEKDTGGGRESGSDAWKGYMRRATNTVNVGLDLPLAQGVRFDL